MKKAQLEYYSTTVYLYKLPKRRIFSLTTTNSLTITLPGTNWMMGIVVLDMPVVMHFVKTFMGHDHNVIRETCYITEVDRATYRYRNICIQCETPSSGPEYHWKDSEAVFQITTGGRRLFLAFDALIATCN